VQVPADAIPPDTVVFTDDIEDTDQTYRTYLRAFESNLAALPTSAFTPNLALFDALFASLTITDNAALSYLIP